MKTSSPSKLILQMSGLGERIEMPFLEYKCSGCNLQTISSFDLTDKKHLDCSAGVGYWVEIDPCPDNRHDYYTAFLNYLFCPYCGEKLIKTPEEFEGGRTPLAVDEGDSSAKKE